MNSVWQKSRDFPKIVVHEFHLRSGRDTEQRGLSPPRTRAKERRSAEGEGGNGNGTISPSLKQIYQQIQRIDSEGGTVQKTL